MYLATVIHNHDQNNRNRNPSDTKSNKAACRQSFRTDCHTLRSENVYRCHLKFFELPKICSACRLVAHKMSRALFGERGSVSRLILSVNCLKSSFYKIQPVTRPHWRRSGSNRQPLPCKGSALPVELRPRFTGLAQWIAPPHLHTAQQLHGKQVSFGVRGLEPRTSALSELRSNHLSYTPRKMFPNSGADILSVFRPRVQCSFLLFGFFTPIAVRRQTPAP